MNRPVHILLTLILSLSLIGCQSTAKSKPANKALVTGDVKNQAEYSHTKEIMRDITDVIIVVPVTLFCVYAVLRAGGLPPKPADGSEIAPGASKASDDQRHLNEWLYSENKK